MAYLHLTMIYKILEKLFKKVKQYYSFYGNHAAYRYTHFIIANFVTQSIVLSLINNHVIENMSIFDDI